jgi:hypothetical protein
MSSTNDICKKATDIAWDIVKEAPCPICGASSSDGPDACAAKEPPGQCKRRKNAMQHSQNPRNVRLGKVPKNR